MNGPERIKKARESMAEALLLKREQLGNKAILTKLYHAVMESLFAMYNIQDMGRLTHSDLIERFEREYVNMGKIDRPVLDVLQRTYDLTHECDCDHMPVPTDEEMRSAMKVAEILINATEGLLETEVRKHESSAV
jgi:uncharacterized protein (UPF0332 family)